MQNELGHCGFVTITGRPNVGKSTLLNRIIGQKISITSRKPQTTRVHVSGIKTGSNSQIIFIDTPGLQKNPANVFNRYMNQEVINALSHVDVIVHLVEALKWTELDENVYEHIRNIDCHLIMAINKIDRIKDKNKLLPFIEMMSQKKIYNEVIPISAKNGDNIDLLEEHIKKYLSAGNPLYPLDQISDRNERFFAAEFIREKLMRGLGEEVPYKISVTIDKFNEEEKLIKIYATIWVSSMGQKKIVIGKNGTVLKKAGEQARADMERMFGKKIFLQTWVKIKNNWTSNIQSLKQFGYGA